MIERSVARRYPSFGGVVRVFVRTFQTVSSSTDS